MVMADLKELPELAASRVVLRALEDSDVPELFAVFSHPEVTRFWSHPPFTDLSDAQSYVEQTRRGFKGGNFLQWGLCRSDGQQVLGTCTLWQIDWQSERAEVGFALGRDHWGQGLMSEGLAAMVEFAFDELGLRRLEADIDPRNQPSIALVERLGFEREGYMRERWQVAGEISDSIFFGLLASDWPPGN